MEEGATRYLLVWISDPPLDMIGRSDHAPGRGGPIVIG